MDMARIDWLAKSRQLTLRVRNVVDGRSRDGTGPHLQKFGPRDGERLYEFPTGSVKDVDAAVLAARTAFSNGSWSAPPVTYRKEALF